MNAPWYVVHTKPRQEDVAVENLERQGYRCYAPQMLVQRARRGRVGFALEAMFPRYVFVQLDRDLKAQSWAPIQSTRGVAKLVRFGSEFPALDHSFIEALRERERAAQQPEALNAGDTVTLSEGPFAGLPAEFVALDADQRVIVLMTLLGKQVRLSADRAAVVRAD